MAGSAPRSASGLLQNRPRTQILLLWLLLINTIGVAVLCVVALRGQLAETEHNRLTAAQHALSALAARVDNAIYQAVQEPYLLLRNVPEATLTAASLQRVREHEPSLRLLLLMDRNFEATRSDPALGSGELQFLAAAVKERVLGKELDGMHARSAPLSFATTESTPPLLYVFEPLGDASQYVAEHTTPGTKSESWLVLGFDMDLLQDAAVKPLLLAFEKLHATRVLLLPPDAGEENSAVSVNLSHMLAGWRLDSVSDGESEAGIMERLGTATIAASVGLVLTIGLISAAIVWSLRREQALLELRNRFVANISHELKTPLSLIRMYAETLYLCRLSSAERINEYHRVILQEAEKLSRMIGDVLAFARLRDGLPLYRLTETDLRRTVLGILSTYSPEWEARGARIETAIAEQLSPVPHDAQAITRLLLNLVDNAIKYAMPAPLIRICLSADRDRTRMEVSDNGAGIEAPRLKRIWAAVQRGQIVADADGSGLGLCLVKQIADAHEAHFVLDSSASRPGVRALISFPGYHTIT